MSLIMAMKCWWHDGAEAVGGMAPLYQRFPMLVREDRMSRGGNLDPGYESNMNMCGLIGGRFGIFS